MKILRKNEGCKKIYFKKINFEGFKIFFIFKSYEIIFYFYKNHFKFNYIKFDV